MEIKNIVELDVYRDQALAKQEAVQAEQAEDLGSAIQELIERMRGNWGYLQKAN